MWDNIVVKQVVFFSGYFGWYFKRLKIARLRVEKKTLRNSLTFLTPNWKGMHSNTSWEIYFPAQIFKFSPIQDSIEIILQEKCVFIVTSQGRCAHVHREVKYDHHQMKKKTPQPHALPCWNLVPQSPELAEDPIHESRCSNLFSRASAACSLHRHQLHTWPGQSKLLGSGRGYLHIHTCLCAHGKCADDDDDHLLPWLPL